MSKPLVSIVMGSDSDLEIMREAGKALDDFGIAYEIDVTSAHRSPDRSADFAKKAAERGIKVIIAGAGGAAHLAGVIAAHTILPVIGVPIPSTSLNGMDSLLSTVQMPAGIPVAKSWRMSPGRAWSSSRMRCASARVKKPICANSPGKSPAYAFARHNRLKVSPRGSAS